MWDNNNAVDPPIRTQSRSQQDNGTMEDFHAKDPAYVEQPVDIPL